MAKIKIRKRRTCALGIAGKQIEQEKMYVLMMDRKITQAISDPSKRLEYIKTLRQDMEERLSELPGK